MQIRRLVVKRFRGLLALTWQPKAPLCCLIGPGDSAKSTILDAIDAALSPRWVAFNETDFFRCDTSQIIEIEVTVGELSKLLLSDAHLGLYIRGCAATGEIHDEPLDDDEPVLTVRLTVDATMEPTWEVYCERAPLPRYLTNRDRALFGVVRLNAEDAKQLTWAQGSVLSKLTDDGEQAAAVLAAAYRTAKDNANLTGISGFAAAAATAQTRAQAMGAYTNPVDTYRPGLELGRGGFSSASIALHAGPVPLRLAGLGTRRLAVLGIQRAAISDGAIVLVDEIEHGLEPHRIIGAIAMLKWTIATATAARTPVGQVLITTHSDVTAGEIEGANLHLVRQHAPGPVTVVSTPVDPAPMTKILKNNPRALFAKRILVVEGPTELGVMLGLRSEFTARHGGYPIEQLGAAIADGSGADAPGRAIALANLGYSVALYRDSDIALSARDRTTLHRLGVPVFEYGAATGMNFEQAIFDAAPAAEMQRLLDFARSEKTRASVDACVRQAFGFDDSMLKYGIENWELLIAEDLREIGQKLATVAVQHSWFKKQQAGRDIAPIVSVITRSVPASPLATCLAAIEAWLYV